MIKGLSKKILICILVFIIIFNFWITSVTYADGKTVEEVEESHNQQMEANETGLAGIISLIFRLPIIAISGVISIEAYAVAISAGKTDEGDISVFITPFDIIFNRFVLTDIDIFSTDELESGSMIFEIRESISFWYGVVNAIAVGLLIAVFVMLVVKAGTEKNAAEKKAKIKQAITDWGFSLLLVATMAMIAIAIINVNNMLVKEIVGISSYDISSAVAALQAATLSTESSILGWGATITYALLAIQTLIFLCKYIFRFFKVSFLIIISPLVPVPYSICRMMGNKTGSSLETWLFEFINAVFTQLIHCIVYTFVVGIALEGFASVTEIKGVAALAPATFAIAAMFFVGPAERLIRSIFKLRPSGGIRNVISSMSEGTKNAASLVNSVTNMSDSIARTTNVLAGAFGVNLEGRNSGSVPDNQTPTSTTSSNIRFSDSSRYSETSSFTRTTEMAGIGNNGLSPAMDLSDTTMVSSMLPNGSNSASESNALALGVGTNDTEIQGRLSELTTMVGGLSTNRAALPPGSEVTDTHSTDTTNNSTDTYEEIYEEDLVESEDAIVTSETKTENDGLTQEQYDRLVEKVQSMLAMELGKLIASSGLSEELRNTIKDLTEKLKSEDTSKWEEKDYRKFLEENGLEEKYLGIAEAIGLKNAAEATPIIENKEEPIVDVIDAEGRVISDPVDDIDADNEIAEFASAAGTEVQNYMRQALTEYLEDNPAALEEARTIATKEAIFKGEIDGTVDYSTASLSNLTVNTAMKRTHTSGDNREEAIKKLQEIVRSEGQAQLDAFNQNPTPETFNVLTDPAKELAIRQNIEAASKLSGVSVRVSETVSGTKSMERSENIDTVVTVSPIVAELAARKQRQGKGSKTD